MVLLWWTDLKIINGSVVSTFTQAQMGRLAFVNSAKIEITTAETSLGDASEILALYKIEGQDLQHLLKAHQDAKSVTLSFM